MSTLQPGTIFAGRYRLDRALARGGMGSLWIAHHLQLDSAVAIKFMDPAFARSADARGRFEREAKACARLKSPHIVQVHDYGIEGETPYIVMELLEGEDLGTRLRRGLLPLSAAASVAHQIGKALRTAHEAGVVHRDLKPANVFLCRHHDEDLVKVVDFGIAKIVGDGKMVGESTVTGEIVGSPHYMSPEQIRAFKHIDHRTDLWSFGVILFRCITGHLPFPGEQTSAVLVAVCADPLPRPSQVAPALGPEVDAFFARALERDPGQRFQSAKELADAFAGLAGDVTAAVLTNATHAPNAAAMVAPPPPGPSVTLSPAHRTLAAPPARNGKAMLLAAAAMLILAAAGASFLLSRPPAVPRGSASSPASVEPTIAVSAPPAPLPSTTASAATSASGSATAEVPSASATVSAPASKKSTGPAQKSKQDETFGF